MALTNCPECGHQVSDKADICPNCGVYLQSKSDQADVSASTKSVLDKMRFSRILIISLSICITVLIGIVIIQSNSSSLFKSDLTEENLWDVDFEQVVDIISKGNSGCFSWKADDWNNASLEERRQAILYTEYSVLLMYTGYNYNTGKSADSKEVIEGFFDSEDNFNSYLDFCREFYQEMPSILQDETMFLRMMNMLIG